MAAEVIIAIVNFDSPAAIGLLDVIDATQLAGHTPKGVIIFGGDYLDSSAGADGVHATFSVGMYDGIQQRASSMYALDNLAASDDGSEWSDTSVINTPNNYVRASAVAFIRNGVRLNFLNIGGGASRYTAIFYAGRDVQTQAGTLANATGNSSVSATVGFQPDLVFVATPWHGGSDLSGQFGDLAFAMGWATNGNGQMGICYSDDDALAAGPAPSSYVHPTAALPLANPTLGTLGAALSVTNFNASGFDLTTTLGTLGSVTASRVNYLALILGEADIKVQAGTTKTSTGTQNYTGFGFDPDTLFLLGSTNTAVSGGARDTTAGSGACFGVANASAQGVYGMAINPAADPSDTYSAARVGDVLALGNNTTVLEHVASVSAWISDGVTLDYTAAGAGAKQLIMVGIATNSTAAVLDDVYAQVVTFQQAAKGVVLIPVDLGGRTPKAIVLVGVNHDPGNDATESLGGGVRGPAFTFSVATASDAQHQHSTLHNHASSTQVSSRVYNNNVLEFTGSTFSQDWDVRLVGFANNLVAINFLNAPISLSQTRRWTMLVLAGEDVEAHLNAQNLGTGTSAIDVTAPDFEPDVVFAVSAFRTATGSIGGAGKSFGIGLNDGADTQRCFTTVESAGTLTVSRPGGSLFNDRILHRLTGATPDPTNVYGVTIGSYDSQGYSVTPSASASSEFASFLAVKMPGIRAHLDDFLTKATTGIESYTGAGFTPRVALVAGGGYTTINTPEGETAALASHYVGMVSDPTDPLKVGVHALRNQNNVDPTVAAVKSSDNGNVIIMGDGANFGDIVAAFDAFTTDGFDLDFTATTGAFLFMSLMLDWDDDTTPPTPPVTVEQSGLLAIVVLNAPLQTFQSGAVVVAQQTANGGVTQSGALIVGNIIQRPFNWVLPEEPIDEAWKWRTDVITSDDGTEQRIAIRSSPRIELTHRFALDNSPDLRRVWRAIWTELGKPVPMPHWPYKTKLTQPTTTGDTRIYFDASKTNLRDGGYAYIQDGDTFQIVRVKTVFADGARLSDTIGPAFTVAAQIMPLTYNFVASGTNLKRVAPDTFADTQLTGLDAATISPVTNAFAPTVTLPDCEDIPILDRRPIGTSFEQAAITGASRLDIGPGVNSYVNPWDRTDLAGPRTFRLSRLNGRSASPPDVEWFRTFCEYTKGSYKPFLAPTWRNDFDLVLAADGSSFATIESDEYFTYYWKHAGFRYVAFEHAGGLIVRQVTAVALSGGDTVLTLNEALPNPMPTVTKVMLAPLSRVNDDAFNLTHYAWYTDVTFNIRTTDQ